MTVAAILVFKMSQNIFKSKHYVLIAHCKPSETILSKKKTLKKTQMRVTAMDTQPIGAH